MKVLFAVDLSEPPAVTEQVVDLVERLGAELYVLHVLAEFPTTLVSTIDPMTGIGDYAPYALYDPELQHNMQEAEEEEFRAFLAERFAGPVRPAVRRGEPVISILEDADVHDVDLIILGKHDHTRLERLLLGTCATKVAEQASRPVLLIPISKT